LGAGTDFDPFQGPDERMPVPSCFRAKVWLLATATAAAVTLAQTHPASAAGEALLLVDAESGKVLYADNATRPWHPASVTKLMTAYVTLHAITDGRLTRALIREFPDYGVYWHISALKFGRRIIRNHNPLIDRYPGADGMKTGFICASGFNLVATVTRGDRRLIAVVLGARSSAVRTEKVLELFERGFNGSPVSWFRPSLGTVDALQPVNLAPPDLHEEVCGKNRHRGETAEEERSEEHTSELQSRQYLVCRLLLEKKK